LKSLEIFGKIRETCWTLSQNSQDQNCSLLHWESIRIQTWKYGNMSHDINIKGHGNCEQSFFGNFWKFWNFLEFFLIFWKVWNLKKNREHAQHYLRTSKTKIALHYIEKALEFKPENIVTIYYINIHIGIGGIWIFFWNFGIFFGHFGNFWKFWKFWKFLEILEIFGNFWIFLNFWDFFGIFWFFERLENFVKFSEHPLLFTTLRKH
jgi:hypothetical protein